MNGFLLTYVMESLEADPERTFRPEHLEARGKEEIHTLVEAGILVRKPTGYEVSLEPLIADIRKLKVLKGKGAPKRLAARITYLGTSSIKAEVYSWFLAFVTKAGQLKALLKGPASRYLIGERIVIVTPSFADPEAPDKLGIPYPVEIVTLGALGILQERDESVRRGLVVSAAIHRPDEREQEIQDKSLESRARVEVTGIAEDGTNLNQVYVNGEVIRIGDRQFKLLLALMCAQFDDPEGFASNKYLKDVDAIGGVADEKSKLVNELRRSLLKVFHDPKQVVETRPGVTRLAIHKSFLSANTDLLKTHRNVMVKGLAARLAERGINPFRGHGS